jgi:hypothetical protein
MCSSLFSISNYLQNISRLFAYILYHLLLVVQHKLSFVEARRLVQSMCISRLGLNRISSPTLTSRSRLACGSIRGFSSRAPTRSVHAQMAGWSDHRTCCIVENVVEIKSTVYCSDVLWCSCGPARRLAAGSVYMTNLRYS